MGKASDWLREERRKTLGDWAAFCADCGHIQRYFEGDEEELGSACPQCAGELRHCCPSCGSKFKSAFVVECEACGVLVRPAEQFGTSIRKQQ